MGGFLYAVGGWDGNKVHNDAYRYDPKKDSWTTLLPMAVARWGHALIPVKMTSEHGGGSFIYAIGGQIDYDQYLNSIERFNVGSGQWESAPSSLSLSVNRGKFDGAIINGTIFVVGGRNRDKKALATVERLTPQVDFSASSQSWTSARPMNTARSYHSVAVVRIPVKQEWPSN